MIQENAFLEVLDMPPFFSELPNWEKGISRQKRVRRKFEVSKNIPLSCRGHSSELLAFGVGLRSEEDLPNSTDGLFREAAEKVDNKITVNKRIYGGAPCVANTRVPVYVILQMVEDGCSHKQILKAFPSIGKEGLEAALRFSVLVMER